MDCTTPHPAPSHPLRALISGGGTGGHIFPALSIADALRAARPDAEILFVGAESRMEMQRVPAAGYPIKGLPVQGFDRRHLLRNVPVLFNLLRSRRMARRIVREFRPDVAVGVGGYASGPTLEAAAAMGIPTLLQEQNSYAGVTNKILSRRARRICVAYDGMERFFPADRIVLTGNPVRRALLDAPARDEARSRLGLDPGKRTLLIVGGSLGARTMNESVMAYLSLLSQRTDVQVMWQTGGFYHQSVQERLAAAGKPANLHVTDFIADMGCAYAAADLVVSRAGAGSISELCLLGKASILVPSPNVAEDHQTKNALALVHKDAALMVTDADAPRALLPKALGTLVDDELLASLGQNASALARPNAAEDIVQEILALVEPSADGVKA